MLKFIKIVNIQLCYLTLKYIFFQGAELYFLSSFEYFYYNKITNHSYKLNIQVWFLNNPMNFDLFLLYDLHIL